MWFGSLSFWGWIWGSARDDQDPYIVRFFHPSTHGFQGRHDLGVQGVQFVGPVDRHACKESDVFLFVEGMKVNGHDLAGGGVHGLTYIAPVLHFIVAVQ